MPTPFAVGDEIAKRLQPCEFLPVAVVVMTKNGQAHIAPACAFAGHGDHPHRAGMPIRALRRARAFSAPASSVKSRTMLDWSSKMIVVQR